MAITTEKGINSRVVNALAVQLIGQETGIIQVIRTPKSVSLDAGIKTKMTQGVDPLGRLAEVDKFVTDFMPTLEINLDGTSYEHFRIGMNRRTIKTAADAITIPIRRQALKGTYAALPTGAYGFEIAINAISRGSAKLNGGTSVLLAQQQFATFVATTVLSYAVGLNGALRFSNDLVAARAIVELSIAATVATEMMSEQELDYQTVRVVYRNSDESVSLLEIPTFQINPEGSKFDSAGDTSQIKGSLLSIGGCEPFTIKQIQSRLACQN
jgi:hypothetical protein